MTNISELKIQFDSASVDVKSLCENSITLISDLQKMLQPKDTGEDTESELDQYVQHLLEFEYSFDIKEFALLLRGICVNTFKYQQFIRDHRITIDQFSSYKLEVKSRLNDVDSQLNESYFRLSQTQKIDEAKEEKFHSLESPYPIIEKQLEDIKSQIQLVADSSMNFRTLSEELTSYINWVQNTQQSFKHSIDLIYHRTNDIHREIKEIGDVQEPNKEHFKHLNQYFKSGFDETDNNKQTYPIKEFELPEGKRTKVPIKINGSHMLVKEFDFENQLVKWEESEIYPILLELQDAIVAHLETALSYFLNGINLMKFLSDSPNNQTLDTLHDSNHKIHDATLELAQTLEKKGALIEQLYKDNLVLSNIFDDNKLFFKSNRIDLDATPDAHRIPFLDEIRNSKIFKKESYASILEKMNFVESSKQNGKIAQVINFVDEQNNTVDEGLTHSLFFTKGYLGATFMIPRTGFDTVFNNGLEKWNKGYAASLLVHGTRLSGKSALVESIHSKYATYSTVNVKAKSRIKVHGHFIDTQFNLGDALSEIDKINRQNRLIIIIDDLELWRDSTHSVVDNARSLINMMYKRSKKLFFVVTMGTELKNALDQFIQFSNSFVHLYQSDYMSLEEVRKAIFIRQGVHSLSQQEGSEAIDSKNMRRLIIRHHNNIGTSLRSWYHYLHEENPQIRKPVNKGFKDMIEENKHILKHILKFKYTNEQELNAMSGTLNSQFLKQSVQILLGSGILKREVITNNLVFNEYIVNDLETNLETHV